MWVARRLPADHQPVAGGLSVTYALALSPGPGESTPRLGESA